MKLLGRFLILTILIISGISALCEDNQIDINADSAEELEKLDGIGPVKAQAIIDYRETNIFDSVDELIEVKGIGEVTLANIKSQGLACVGDGAENNEEVSENITNSQNVTNNDIEITPIVNSYQSPQPQIIKLNYPQNYTKDIKSGENYAILSKDGIAMYGFFVFSAVIVVLLVIRRKKIYQNDFR